ncbi:MAG: 2-isopropylmalate synthase [Gammaproteobacteria bacterium]|jgi:2-isopropylmalate synthase|nr:2-isopropylmalate synthase [Gammaproteobacteria bacterium]
MNPGKYITPTPLKLTNRLWPSRQLNQAPLWCSLDLSDGNRALVEPMELTKQLRMFELLIKLGFKEIEVCAPPTSEVAHKFVRTLIEKNLIPKDVFLQIPLQARENLIKESINALQGCKNIILHLYNPTSVLQREVVLQKDRQAIIDLAVNSAKLIQQLLPSLDNANVRFQYSPEGFSGTEPEFAVAICNAIIDIWQPTPQNKLIINLAANVELSMPNVYADQIEWFCQQVNKRDSLIISAHTLNDRGSAVAAAELAMLAGAERVEATLLGNGERAGNASSVTLALNLLTHGIDPKLNLTNLPEVIETIETCTQMKLPARQPYAGELVFTAFSDAIQDAINKGLTHQQSQKRAIWEVPYLIIDPKDIGRSYEGLVRLNSQSGKSGLSYLMEKKLGYHLPLELRVEFGKQVQRLADETNKEITVDKLQALFNENYIDLNTPFHLLSVNFDSPQLVQAYKRLICRLIIDYNGQNHEIEGEGIGIIDTIKTAITKYFNLDFNVEHYSQHALALGSDAKAVTYIKLADDYGHGFWGVGIDEDTTLASLKAFMSALNRSCIE